MPSVREALRELRDAHAALQKEAGKWLPMPADLASRAVVGAGGKVRAAAARGAYHAVKNTGAAALIVGVPAAAGYGLYKTLKGAKAGSKTPTNVDPNEGTGVY